jgi:hypothetical protein
MYTNVTNYSKDETLEAVTETVVSRSVADTRTVYVPKGSQRGMAIPARGELKLDMSKVAAASVWANQIRFDFSGEK